MQKNATRVPVLKQNLSLSFMPYLTKYEKKGLENSRCILRTRCVLIIPAGTLRDEPVSFTRAKRSWQFFASSLAQRCCEVQWQPAEKCNDTVKPRYTHNNFLCQVFTISRRETSLAPTAGRTKDGGLLRAPLLCFI